MANDQPDSTSLGASSPNRAAASFVSEASGVFNGRAMRYRVEATDTYIRDATGMPVASFFTVAYLGPAGEDRPVMFVFNGGPGSSAQWLHMGAFGPRRIVLPARPEAVCGPPYSFLDNTESPLDRCDLVFIDPIGTGYSRPLGAQKLQDFWGLREDSRSVADFIQTWITDHDRWNSPKYLAGESYGTTRAALVADILSSRYISLNGIVLVSAVLDHQQSRQQVGDGGVLSYVSFLPSLAAAAWYHGRVDRDGLSLQEFLEDVRGFASTEYAQALLAGCRASHAERSRVAAKVARYTGLPPAYVEQSRLRVMTARYFKELLRQEGRAIGRLDSRYSGLERDVQGEVLECDSTSDAISGAFTTAMNVQLRDIGVRMDSAYVSNRIIDDWKWSLEDKPSLGGGYVNVMPHLGRAIRRNARLRLLVASGYYDLATPFFGVENALSQDEVVSDRTTYAYYEAGHMIFVHEPSRVQLLSDVNRFVLGANA